MRPDPDMPAAVYRGKGEIAVERRPVPDPGPGEVLVQVSHCGVCGSDLHMVLDGWGRPGSVGGHEWSGRIAGVGPGVNDWSVGAPVVGSDLVPCGACVMCDAGRPSLCAQRAPVTGGHHDGAFARFVVTAAAGLVPVEEGVSLRAAALTEPLAVAALRAHGVDDVVVSEPAASRRDRALAVGARATVTPGELESPVMPMDLVTEPYDAVLECSGRAEAMESGLAQLGRGGRLVLVGAGMHAPRLDNNRVLLNELEVTGAYNYDPSGFGSALALLGSGALPIELLAEPEDIPLPGLLEAMHKLAAAEIAAKVLVVPDVSGR